MSPRTKTAASLPRRSRARPRGIVTFLFTDVEGSTRLLHDIGAERYAKSLAEHRRIIRQACAAAGGVEIDTQGDAFFIAFEEATNAVGAAQAIAEALADGPMRVRVGLHTGRPILSEEGYVGEDVHLGARIAAAGHGGQILISLATRDAIAEAILAMDLGEHRLKDIGEPVSIFQLGTAPFPPLKTISNTNLPRPVDSFVGREGELGRIVGLLGNGTRLLTLLGPGGTGKTRLALEAAATLVPHFKAGTFWVDLSPVRAADRVAGAVAATLTTEQDLGAYIGEREMLLVLDNFEQVIEAAQWIASLVSACANLKVIVTSRERLRVRGEITFDVPTLDETESIRLFEHRAGLQPTADVVELCNRLEHLPLAVELAAARTAALTPRQILDRLGDRLDVLKGGRDADPRQRTLRATIDWSHGLLDLDEQRLFRRLSIFGGGASLEAVEAVCDGDLDTIESLIDKNLVRSTDGRYSMLETIREYAGEQLERSGERDDQRTRHARWLHEAMAGGIPAVASGGDDDAARSLAAEFANLQLAFAWHGESGDSAGAAALIDTVWWFVGDFLSQNRAGLAMCDAALAIPGLTDPDRALIRHREGNFAAFLGNHDRARAAWADAANLAHRVGNRARESATLQNLALTEKDPDAALDLFERSIALQPPASERDAYHRRWNLAGLKRRTGDLDAGMQITAEVLAWAEQVGDYTYISAGQREMGELALDRGDASEALERAARSRDAAESRGHALAQVLAETLRCRAAIRLRQYDEAIESATSMIDLLRHGDIEADHEVVAAVLGGASEVLAGLGDLALAASLESVRQRLVESIPSTIPQVERTHADWLRANNVAAALPATDLDVPSALAAFRDWLAHRA